MQRVKVHGGDKLDSQSRGLREERVDVSALVLSSVGVRLLSCVWTRSAVSYGYAETYSRHLMSWFCPNIAVQLQQIPVVIRRRL